MVRAEGAESERDALEEVAALKARGGHVAAHRLRALIETESDPVRRAALEATAQVGLRSKDMGETVRKAVRTAEEPALRAAALGALGRVGDAGDMPALLDALKAADADVQAAGLEAIRELTGRRLSLSYRRCASWWESEEKRMPAGVRRALRELPDAEGKERQVLRETLARDGWAEIRYVKDAAKEWLQAGDRSLRAQGFYLAASLRLGDLVADVESALPYLTGVDGPDGLLAVRALGINPEVLAPYWQRRLEGEGEEKEP